MRNSFEKSQDLFDQKIFECFDRVERILKYGKKTSAFEDPTKKEEHHKICILVSRTDIFRYAMLYKFGGLYCDLSSKCEVDIDKELAQYDIFLVKSVIQVYTSLIYGKTHNLVLRKILEHVIEATAQAQTKSVCQMYLGGPRMLTAAISELSETYDLSKLNGKIELAEKISSWFLVQSYDWKKELHQPDPNRPFLKVNSHWLNKDF
jgi:mannosyltransferase OCH1-like enzyme